ncbi:hypothetical protein GFL39_11640 [Rhizobium leguminosarum bv. viciae]|uniref:hypothetical protein n=1 Tax=Rhizobium leguminosarum TaxID=384 RepID=UPI0014422E3F|nr:hypothetical protein [Rhizobium leguminosarum]NKL05599.1 hypothetical protein [Rhizobium leguminosarum bv. viciae]
MAVSCNFDPSNGINPGHRESSLKDTEPLVCASDKGPPTSEGEISQPQNSSGPVARWRIEAARPNLWARGVQPASYFIFDEVTRAMLAGITVSRKSAGIVIGLLDSALSATTPPRLITPSELDFIQGGASALGMRVFYAVQDQPVGHLASGTKSSKGIASSRVEETQRDEPLVRCVSGFRKFQCQSV